MYTCLGNMSPVWIFLDPVYLKVLIFMIDKIFIKFLNLMKFKVGMQTGAATVENCMEVPQKIKNRTTL